MKDISSFFAHGPQKGLCGFKRSQIILTVPAVALAAVCFACSVPYFVSLKKFDTHYAAAPDPDKGLVYIYREKWLFGTVRGVYVQANGKRIGAVNSGTYFVYLADPGKNVFSVENQMGEERSRSLNVEAGKTYYLRINLTTSLLDVEPYIAVIHDAEGAGAIESLTYAILN